MVLRLPPLRARADRLALARAPLRNLAGPDVVAPEFHSKIESLLLSHPWPGNVRELKSVLAVARAAARGNVSDAAKPLGIARSTIYRILGPG